MGFIRYCLVDFGMIFFCGICNILGVGMDFDTNMKMSVLNLSNLSCHVRFLLFDVKIVPSGNLT